MDSLARRDHNRRTGYRLASSRANKNFEILVPSGFLRYLVFIVQNGLLSAFYADYELHREIGAVELAVVDTR